MRVWTIQPLSALEDIKISGSFRCDPEKSWNITKENNLKVYYQWLNQQMTKTIGPAPAGVTYPVWSWYRWEGENVKPDADSGAFLKRTEDKVLFELEMPTDRVFLSDFDLWQFVLADGYVPSEEDDEDTIDRLDALSPEEYEKEKIKSWSNVIIDEETQVNFAQATFWEIRREDIVSYDILTQSEHKLRLS